MPFRNNEEYIQNCCVFSIFFHSPIKDSKKKVYWIDQMICVYVFNVNLDEIGKKLR